MPDQLGGIGDIFTARGQQPPILSRTSVTPAGTIATPVTATAPVSPVTSSALPAATDGTAPILPVKREPLPDAAAPAAGPGSINVNGQTIPKPKDWDNLTPEAQDAYVEKMAAPVNLGDALTRLQPATPGPVAAGAEIC